ncbi:HEAT repeat domain-containing protein [Roseimaritima sediminicola]|uniref:HEAT repeat domain-containing protein n=1 Tax=Roseimaritima sediminicola TaxID=2662066 RepID=UPI0012983FDD|nr:HEAT repeat domain-containing protein [Roseimaritima sediminicola]
MDGTSIRSWWGLLGLGLATLLFPTAPAASGAEAQWIWDAGVAKEQIPTGTSCFFRKRINLRADAVGKVTIAADDAYELYVNGRRVGTGRSARKMTDYDISSLLVRGRNVVSVRVDNTHGTTAALAARISIQPEGTSRWYTFSTDETWKTTRQAAAMWQSPTYNDSRWGQAQSFGMLGSTVPWDRQEDVASATEHQESARFQIQDGFGVQRLFDDEQTGSLIAMAFNEFGHIIAARERGPLLLMFDRSGDGIPDEVRTYCDQVESCQGILALNGDVFVTGQGPDGTGLYRLSDADRNGTLEKVQTILKFKGTPGEHGPHGIVLGPDGMLYVSVGNHMQVVGEAGSGETLPETYEGDLVGPRYEDPGGHARGVKAPGGTVIRTTVSGDKVERIAGGLRNAYDLAFHSEGSLFIHDSDMESDAGAAWYRPTALYDVTEGGEFGWRSGWAKWPEFYADRLPTILDTGRGSPSGALCYEHYTFPARYHGSLFLADWSEGRILNVRLKANGASYVADSQVFLQGEPLNVTDLAVGPDGALYFCTGGRETAGGIYRVVWEGPIPERVNNLGTGIAAAIRQPQPSAAWSRQTLAGIKKELGSQWAELVAGVAYSDENPPHYRTRALELMELFGPQPSEELLVELSRAQSEVVRAKAAYMMGVHPSTRTERQLVSLLDDRDLRVRRMACEAMLRTGQQPPIDALLPLLEENDRTLAFVARRVLESVPTEQWRREVLQSEHPRVAILGSLALVTVQPTEANSLLVLSRLSQLMNGFLSDADFVDLLRVMQVALARGQIDPAQVQPLRDQIAEEFPSGDSRMNRELMRLAAYLRADSIGDRALDYLEGDAPLADRVHVAMHMRYLTNRWTAKQRFELLKFYEQASKDDAGSSVPLYLMNVTRDFAKHLTLDDAMAILEQGDAWPNAALASMYKLPQPVDAETAELLIELDQSIAGPEHTRDVYKRLRTGIVAMLSMTGDEDAMSYLRKIWRTDPERRQPVAMGLALHPDGQNWDYLVRSLNILEGEAAKDVLKQLTTVAVATDDPEALRQVILLGLQFESEGQSTKPAQDLLSHWTGLQRSESSDPSMAIWQRWYAKTYPDRPAAELPSAEEDARWDFDQLAKYLESEEGRHGDPAAGSEVFAKADCASCHRFGNQGQSVGPDLTSVSRRFTRREVLESILYPSHVISDQYMNKKVLTLDGKVYVGLVSETGSGELQIRDAKNNTTTVASAEVDQILPSNSSIMPSGGLDQLTLKEISDLMSYLGVLPPLEVATRPSN